MIAPAFDLVIPSIGRPSLAVLLGALAAADGTRPRRVLVVDDRPDGRAPLFASPPPLAEIVTVLGSGGRGPAAARNVGWRAADAPFVVFLDDDVVTPRDWLLRLAADLAGLRPRAAASQGRIRVPTPVDRRPTDWERNVRALEHARWATADIAYRRDVLGEVDGFNERFPHAYREDADLALRVMETGRRLVVGTRHVTHPVRESDRWVSVRLQRGNADDVLMWALHGPGWRERAGVPRGRRRAHLALTGAAIAAIAAGMSGKRGRAAIASGIWLAGTAEFAWRRIGPGPRTWSEIRTMIATSAVLPIAATYYWAKGWFDLRHLLTPGERRSLARRVLGMADSRGGQVGWRRSTAITGRRPRAVIFDRDGTLVVDVPYNGDPDRVAAVPGAREALDRLRAAGIAIGVVSNQAGIARGLVTANDVDAVNRRIDAMLGPIDPWLYCPHGPDDGCACRKPRPGLVLRAAAMLGVRPEDLAVVGDTGADVGAARAAGARALLVPTPATRREEIVDAPEVAPDIRAAVDLLLGDGIDARRTSPALHAAAEVG